MDPIMIGAGMAAGNTALNALGMGMQTDASKDLMDYQWKNFTSPQAQVRNMAAAGLNPAALLGSGKGSFASPSVSMPSSIPVQLGGVDTLANYLVAKSQAKKNDVDTRLTDIEAKIKQFELDLSKTFASKERIANLLSAYKGLQLQDDEHSRNGWSIAKEKALSELSGIQKDTAQKVFDNMDTQISQENKQREENIRLTQEKQRTEKSGQSANYASAEASRASARNYEAEAFINQQEGRIRKVLADNQTNPQVVRKQLETLFEELKAKKMQSTLDAEKAFEEWRHINYENDYFMDKKYDARVDYFLSWLRKRIGAFPMP